MGTSFLKIGQHIFNVAAIAGVHWEQDKLFIHYNGGRFASLQGDEGKLLWEKLGESAEELSSAGGVRAGSAGL